MPSSRGTLCRRSPSTSTRGRCDAKPHELPWAGIFLPAAKGGPAGEGARLYDCRDLAALSGAPEHFPPPLVGSLADR
jgi:hypothetical protein